jgi:hypothetical protein
VTWSALVRIVSWGMNGGKAKTKFLTDPHYTTDPEELDRIFGMPCPFFTAEDRDRILGGNAVKLCGFGLNTTATLRDSCSD